MAGDNRASSSLFRRAEQIRRWQESETNRVVSDKVKKRKVKFSDGCIFLAAGAAGDKDELKRLLDRGADINTVNQDGITALHAACIDNNLEIVEFLVDSGADINRCDMEGWTPLHATASCGSLTMAKFLIDRSADLSVVNNDGELAIDVVDEDDMGRLLQEEMDIRGIDCDASRSCEERSMLGDAQCWLGQGQIAEKPHPKTGATALHVAAAKGYIKVMRLLIQAGANINTKDFDGWTPLHAAVHWAQTEAVEILCDSMADMDIVNCLGQAPIDLADDTTRPLLDELKRKQASIKLISQNKVSPKKRKTSPQTDRSKKKEREPGRVSSDGTSSDESTESVEKKSLVGQCEVQSWRRPSLRNRAQIEDKNTPINDSKEEPKTPPHNNSEEAEPSKEPVNKKEEKYCPDAPNTSESNATSTSPTRTNNSAHTERLTSSLKKSSSTTSLNSLYGGSQSGCDPSNRTTPTATDVAAITAAARLSASSVIRNFFKSFAPPSRDEESETQRRAHAKMVRSTRRSTQGITLEDVRSAEQLIKTKQTTANNVTTTTTSQPPTDPVKPKRNSVTSLTDDERRPSWRLKIDHIDKNRFSLEDVRSKSRDNEAEDKKKEDKKEDKSEDKSSTTREGTQAVIHRRKKAKRRSTGVVHVDMDEIDPDRKSSKDNDDDEEDSSVSEKEGTTRGTSSRRSSTKENGDINYKKLYEEQLTENDRLMNRLRSYEKELRGARETLATNNKANSARTITAEAEKREKRALERKLSEMEDELKEFEAIRQENQRLRDENGALIRVISKLSR